MLEIDGLLGSLPRTALVRSPVSQDRAIINCKMINLRAQVSSVIFKTAYKSIQFRSTLRMLCLFPPDFSQLKHGVNNGEIGRFDTIDCRGEWRSKG